MTRIYLDHAATSPLLPGVSEAMAAWLDAGNASSLHEEGRQARAAIDQAREALSDTLGCLFAEVLFTSSGTEAANLALIGIALNNQDPTRNRILMSAIEHHCVLETRPILERLGYKVDLIPANRQALVDLNQLESMLAEDVLLVSVMHANNEIGTIQPARTIADLAHRFGAFYHCDAVQTFLVPIDNKPWQPKDLDADILTISAHKIGGPKGVGAIYTRAGVILKPLMVGGGQEREMRAGTENVAAIVGFAEAICLQAKLNPTTARDTFVKEVKVPGLIWTTPFENALPGHAHCRIPGISAETMLIRLDREGIAASSGAACSSGSLEPSHVLQACGFTEQESKEGLRFTFGKRTTENEAVLAAQIFGAAALSIRSRPQP